MSDKLTEKFLSKEVVFPGKIIRLEHWQVELPNGETALREVACHPGASAVVALDDEGNVILVRQHRIAVGRLTLEIPAGKLDSPDEDPFLCAQRELSEETGMTARNWQKLTCLETTPGFCNERIHIYLATGLSQGDCHPDEDEFVDVTRMPLAQAVALVMDGTFRDGKTALGVMMAAALQGVSTHSND
ncbi:MAG: NUDIX hydrolase [Clostridiales bacterium]|nr:NUDIX hydrolase [Clostridiales bacterium]